MSRLEILLLRVLPSLATFLKVWFLFLSAQNSTVFSVSCFLFSHVSRKPHLSYVPQVRVKKRKAPLVDVHRTGSRCGVFLCVFFTAEEMALTQPSACSFILLLRLPSDHVQHIHTYIDSTAVVLIVLFLRATLPKVCFFFPVLISPKLWIVLVSYIWRRSIMFDVTVSYPAAQCWAVFLCPVWYFLGNFSGRPHKDLRFFQR